jgi:putative membrane protein
LSFALALLIGFRVHNAYDRWWEARKLWGSLVNVSRNLAVKVRELQRPDAGDRQTVRDLIVAFSVGLKDHLRDDPQLTRLPGFESDGSRPKHLPSYITAKLYGVFHRWRASGAIGDEGIWILDAEARMFLEVCGACERIKNTLMSISWRSITRQSLVVALLLLPWGLIHQFGIWTVVISILVGYFLLAGETIARWVEEPFGTDEDHLDLDGICRAIEASVSEILAGESSR